MAQLFSRLELGLALLALVLTSSACSAASAQEPNPARTEQTWYMDVDAFNKSAHAGLDCAECHTNIKMADVPDRHPDTGNLTADAAANFDYRACERCHPQEYAAYQTGIHSDVQNGTRVSNSGFSAPTCGNCHSPHYVQAHASRASLLVMQVDVCGTCHPVERETYLNNFHGKAAVNLGETRSAGCTDCHGGHQVRPLVKTEDALTACQRCHPDATPNMAGFLIHARENVPSPDTRRADQATVLLFARIFFTLLIVGVLGFFYAHTLIWLIRSLHNRMRGG